MKSIGDSFRSPLAIFLYNRPESTTRLFDCLNRAPLFRESPVFVFIDGPKTESDIVAVEAVKTLVLGVKHPDLEIFSSKKNKGLKNSIFDGVGKVCNTFDRVIVLEDDLEISLVALDYFNSALTRYAENNSVYSVCGYLPGAGIADASDALILPYSHPWGWATWARAWRDFRIEPETAERYLTSRIFRERFNLGGLNDYADMLHLANTNAIDSWYIYWYFYIFKKQGVSIFPPQSYVRNRGSEGTHSNRLNPISHLLNRKALWEGLPEFPSNIEIDYWALDKLASCLESRVQRMSSRIGSLRRRIRG